jgi:hypothetical protein
MRRSMFFVPVLLLAGACTGPVEPTTTAGEPLSTSGAAESISSSATTPVDTVQERGSSGILIGSGT